MIHVRMVNRLKCSSLSLTLSVLLLSLNLHSIKRYRQFLSRSASKINKYREKTRFLPAFQLLQRLLGRPVGREHVCVCARACECLIENNKITKLKCWFWSIFFYRMNRQICIAWQIISMGDLWRFMNGLLFTVYSLPEMDATMFSELSLQFEQTSRDQKAPTSQTISVFQCINHSNDDEVLQCFFPRWIEHCIHS